MAARIERFSRVRWLLVETAQKLWVRVTGFAVLGVLTAALGFFLQHVIPDGLAGRIGVDAVESILEIIASSMLTVTTFSLSILTAAYATASSGATPRSVRLLVRDPTSQTVLATFIGAFVFSLVSLIMLKTRLYGDEGRVVLFGATVLVILIVVISLLRWIDRLGEMGLIGDTLAQLEGVTSTALAERLASPWLGANPLRGPPPEGCAPVFPDKVGHVQHCDMARLSKLAEEHEVTVYLQVTPGDLAHPGQPAFLVAQMPPEADELGTQLLACLTLRPQRDFRQDPRFGFTALSEMGQRALSPAVNDPGTAIAVAQAVLRILSQWREHVVPEVSYPRLYLPSLTVAEILRDSFLPLARDGAAHAEVHLSLQQILLALGRIAPQVFAASGSQLSEDILRLANLPAMLPEQAQHLRELAKTIRTGGQEVVALG